MKPVAFDYCRPDSIEEALAVVSEYGPDAAVLAGGMSLGPMLNMRLVRPTVVVDIHRLEPLRGIAVNGALEIGAATPQVDAMNHAAAMQRVPLLARALPNVGHYQTRNRGTFGGSVAHADPSAEIPLCLLTLGGRVTLRSRRHTRTVAAADFFVGILSTAKEADEIITSLTFPIMAARSGCAFEEIAQRHGDFALASAAASSSLDGAGKLASLRLGFGGVEDRPVLADTSQWLGQSPDAPLARDIAVTTARALDPAEDATATSAYRRALAEGLAERVLAQAFAEAQA